METEGKPITPVLGEELLYRCVGDTDLHHGCDAQGRLVRLGHSAFNDPDRTPSVDRATLRDDGPQATRFDEPAGVVTLSADEVRSISTVVTFTKQGQPLHRHTVDVRHVPELGNYAHALIETAPHAAGDGAWKKLKEALCVVATKRGWAFPPASVRP